MGVVDLAAAQEGRWAADSVSFCPARSIHVRPVRRTQIAIAAKDPWPVAPVAQAEDERIVTLPLHGVMSYGDVNVAVALDRIAGASAVE